MKKVYLPELLKDISHIPLLYPQLGIVNKETALFSENKFTGFDTPFFEIIENLHEADFIIVPHEYTLIRKIDKTYLEKVQKISKESGIPLLLYVAGDFDEEIDIPNAVILRASKKTKKLKKNEFIIPPLVDDLSPEGGFDPLTKGDVPRIGFCGWAGFDSRSLFIKAVVKNFLKGIRNIFTAGYFYGSDRNGVLLRKKILSRLSKSKVVNSNFIVRTAFGQNKQTINVDPKKARTEFIQNIQESDFSLAVRGYGNYSVRFYEILSAGRIPLFIDTDSPLPLEDHIDYSKILVRVDHRDIKEIDQIISDFYSNITNEEFVHMQRDARRVYEKCLRVSSFYRILFEEIL